jgi:hypothetical protein
MMSLLSVPGAEAAGFTPVGEVMGSVVHQVGWTGPGRGVAYAALGTAIARFRENRAAPAGALTILPLNRELPD